MTEHNSAVETNTSSEAGTSSEVKISLSFQRWNVTIITRGIVLKYSIFLFVSFPAVFLLLLEVRALEADRGTTGEFQLLPSLFMLSPSTSVCSVVPSVLVVTVDYCWYGRQDPGTFGYRIPRTWICNMVHRSMGCPL